MIPRYHPQIRIRDILRSMLPGSTACSFVDLMNRNEPQQKTDLYWFDRGTSALTVALQALNLPKNSGVAVPVYTCVTVFEAIVSAGLKCVFIDVDPYTFAYDKQSLRSNSDACEAAIVLHTFGFPGDVDAVARIMPGKPIIEDCSHAMPGYPDAEPLGLKGTAGIFSFNYHKPLSVGGGGLLLLNEQQYKNNMRKIIETLDQPTRLQNLKAAIRHVVIAILYRRPCYGLMVSAGLIKLRRQGALKANVKPQAMSVLQQRLLARRSKAIGNRFVVQKDFAARIVNIVGSHSPIAAYVSASEKWNGYGCPILVESHAQREASLDFFYAHKVDAFVLWPECLETAASFGYRPTQCPRLEDALERVFMLPCYAELGSSQQDYICRVVTKWKESIRCGKTISGDNV